MREKLKSYFDSWPDTSTPQPQEPGETVKRTQNKVSSITFDGSFYYLEDFRVPDKVLEHHVTEKRLASFKKRIFGMANDLDLPIPTMEFDRDSGLLDRLTVLGRGQLGRRSSSGVYSFSGVADSTVAYYLQNSIGFSSSNLIEKAKDRPAYVEFINSCYNSYNLGVPRSRLESEVEDETFSKRNPDSFLELADSIASQFENEVDSLTYRQSVLASVKLASKARYYLINSELQGKEPYLRYYGLNVTSINEAFTLHGIVASFMNSH